MGEQIVLTPIRSLTLGHRRRQGPLRSPTTILNLETMDPDTEYHLHLQAPVLLHHRQLQHVAAHHLHRLVLVKTVLLIMASSNNIRRSEERRVGKECPV